MHEVTVYLDKYRKKGRAANTIHFVCSALALLYRELDAANINLLARLGEGQFLSVPELDRLASATQYRRKDLNEDDRELGRANVINFNRIVLRRSRKHTARLPVNLPTHASRLRYIADYLVFISNYVAEGLSSTDRRELEGETERALRAFLEHIPAISKRAKLGARTGLIIEEQAQVMAVVHAGSPNNPWKRGIVRRRNWLFSSSSG